MSFFSGDRQSVIAPAKLNLTLAVLGKRGDGYHEIASVVAKIAFYDGLDLYSGDGPAMRVECSDPSVPTDARNLVWRAMELLASRARQPQPLKIRLLKRIPIGAGLGGGSSDAAATLLALNQRWRLGLGLNQLTGLAALLGSDVPMFLHPGAVYVSGRGEVIEPVKLPWSGWVVLVFPAFGTSTAAVYQARSACATNHTADHARVCLQPAYDTADKLDGVLFNDLQESVFALQPRLREIKAVVQEISGRNFHITGSGSTLFACLDSHQEAEELRRKIEQRSALACQITKVLTSDDNE